MTAMDRRVWILGAGFSKSLGGPLLTDLLTTESAAMLRARFTAAKVLDDSASQTARELYAYGTRFAFGRPSYLFDQLPGERFWGDAEEYLDLLDAAAHAGSHSATWRVMQDRITRVFRVTYGPGPEPRPSPPGVRDVRNAARRLMAAECAAFLVDADPETERWAPYVAWVNSLTARDVVITFNYDRVLETAQGHTDAALHVVTPGEGMAADKANVLKLHGSVDWRRLEVSGTGEVIFRKEEDPHFCVTCEDYEIAIASPGPTKRRATKELAALWRQALNAVEQASVVIFVGYRFPPTDAEARNALLGALSKATRSAVHTVLGPETGSSTSSRLRGLLQAVTRRQPEQHPMYAEDFLGLSERLAPYRRGGGTPGNLPAL